MSRQYKRHDKSSMRIHWFNALCWLLLLITGLGLISNAQLNPLGDWYPETIRSLVGGGGNLLTIHIYIGFAWIISYMVYVLINLRGALFFLREVFTVKPGRDMVWMFRKMILMTLGEKGLKALGQPTELPDQGFYNMGQKAFAQASVIGGLVIAATGVIMFLSDKALTAEQTALVSWSITLHYLAVGLVFAGLLVHVYMAAISPDERPGFISMFTGSVPGDYAEHHHRLWYDSIKAQGESE